MFKVHMHAGAIRKLLYGCAYVRELKLVDNLPVHTHKPYNNLHFLIYVPVYIMYPLTSDSKWISIS